MAEAGQPSLLLRTDELREFWEFVTKVRRSSSLAARESEKLRGVWLTEDLVVQRVHGWGPRAVRLLCVRARTDEQRAQLREFFEQDRRNLEGRLAGAGDPCDREDRVLVKLPYCPSLDAWVGHERRVLADLAGEEGVPVLAEPLYFEDVGVHAAAYRYSAAPSLQERLETGRPVQAEGAHQVAAFTLSVLARAHARGWLHTDLQPKNVLLATDRPDGEAAPAQNLICGWGHATRRPPVPVVPIGLLDSLRQHASSGSGTGAGSGEPGWEPGGPSIYSAPEQFVGLFTGTPQDSEATDVYRAAALTLMAVRGRGPLGTSGQAMEAGAAQSVDRLRNFCHQRVLRCAEAGAGADTAVVEEELQGFAAALLPLLQGRVDVSGCGSPELELWFQDALSRDPIARHQTSEDALEALDAAWSKWEARLISERSPPEPAEPAAAGGGEAPPPAAGEEDTQEVQEGAPQGTQKRQAKRFVLERPPELANMHVL